MKRLILLRHAKAVTKAGLSDFDRALAPRGHEEAIAMAAALAAAQPRVDLALVSSARRTRETWLLAGAGWGDVPVTYDRAIYEATTRELLKLVGGLDDAAGAAVMVGHNPGFEELAIELAAASAGAARDELAGGMPTGAAAILDFDVATWRAVAPGEGRLAAFLTPSSLGAKTTSLT